MSVSVTPSSVNRGMLVPIVPSVLGCVVKLRRSNHAEMWRFDLSWKTLPLTYESGRWVRGRPALSPTRGPSVAVPLAQRAHHTDPGADAELGEDPRQMGLNGAIADEKPLGDLMIGAPLGHQGGDLELPPGQAVRPGAPAGGRVHAHPQSPLLPYGLRVQRARPAGGEDLRGGAQLLQGRIAFAGLGVGEAGGQLGPAVVDAQLGAPEPFGGLPRPVAGLTRIAVPVGVCLGQLGEPDAGLDP